MDDTLNYQEILNNYNIRVTFAEYYDAIHALVYYSKKGHYHVSVNSLLAFTVQQKAFLHELKHIIEDIPKCSYAVCFDIDTEDVCRIELEAETFVKEVSAAYIEENDECAK